MKKFLTITLMLCAFSQATFAMQQQGSFGVLLGASLLDKDIGGRFGYGVEGSYNINEMFSAGVWITNSTKTVGTTISAKVDARVTNMMATAAYRKYGLYIGPMLGFSTLNVDARLPGSTLTVSASETNFSYGIFAGYDFTTDLPNFSFGPEFAYVNTPLSSVNSNYSSMNILFAGKYLF